MNLQPLRSAGATLVVGVVVGWLAGCGPHSGPPPDLVTPFSEADHMSEPPFVEIGAATGIDFVHDPGGVGRFFFPEIMSPGAALFDMDNDGDLDAYLVNGGTQTLLPRTEESGMPVTNRLFRQEPNGSFVDVSQDSGLDDHHYGMGVAVGDVNNDGLADVYVTNYGPDRLFLNRGAGKFEDVTERAGIDNDRWSASACFFDFDRDGWLDLFVTNYVDYQPFQPCNDAGGRLDYCNPAVFPRTTDRLFRNASRDASIEHDPSAVRFADVSLSSGIATKPGAGLGVVCADLNADRWPDVYVANDGHANFLWINQRDGTFRDEAVLLGAAYDALGRGQAGMGIALGDLNRDGQFDLLVTHLEGESNALYVTASAGFEESSAATGLAAASIPYTGFGAAFLDLEHDGDLDLVVVNGRVRRSVQAPVKAAATQAARSEYQEPNQLFLYDGKGFKLFRHSMDPFSTAPEISRALVVGDLDNDGDLDLLVTNTAGPARLFRNDAVKQGKWLSVRAVEPAHGGRDAYGAVVIVSQNDRQWRGMVNPGSSYLASHDPRVNFGLGPVEQVDRIEVLWPDGSRESFSGGPTDRFLVLAHGEGDVE